MKKFILSAVVAISFLGLSNVADAQTLPTNQAVMAVTLTDVVSVVVTTPIVPMVLTAASYEEDQEYEIPSHLTVLATQPYDLAVKTSSTALTDPVSSNTIPLDVVKIECTGSGLGTAIQPAVTLSQSDQQLLNEAPTGLANLITVKYTLLSKTNFTSFAGKTAGAYTATIVYTASID